MKPKLVLHHDDPPCEEKLVDGFCPKCQIRPDMQSTCFHYFCLKCNVPLKKMICPNCHEQYQE